MKQNSDSKASNLIAAAPDLLHACEYFNAVFTGLSQAQRDTLPNDVCNAQGLIEAAISKAHE